MPKITINFSRGVMFDPADRGFTFAWFIAPTRLTLGFGGGISVSSISRVILNAMLVDDRRPYVRSWSWRARASACGVRGPWLVAVG